MPCGVLPPAARCPCPDDGGALDPRPIDGDQEAYQRRVLPLCGAAHRRRQGSWCTVGVALLTEASAALRTGPTEGRSCPGCSMSPSSCCCSPTWSTASAA